MTDSDRFLIAGLGNPGPDYARTRHNIGFMVVDAIAEDLSLKLTPTRFNADCARGRLASRSVHLAKPQSYMNRSGFSIQKICSYFDIDPSCLIVVHDDLDLPFGRVRLAWNRGHGGHNGVRSVVEMLGTRSFCRVRVGVGRPDNSGAVVGHVLGRFSRDETARVDGLVSASADACRLVLTRGITAAMNEVNAR